MLAEDEQLSPTFEEMILAYVLGLIDIRLPGHVKKHYCHLIGLTNSIIDFRTDMLAKVPVFLREIEASGTSVSVKPEGDGDSLAR